MGLINLGIESESRWQKMSDQLETNFGKAAGVGPFPYMKIVKGHSQKQEEAIAAYCKEMGIPIRIFDEGDPDLVESYLKSQGIDENTKMTVKEWARMKTDAFTPDIRGVADDQNFDKEKSSGAKVNLRGGKRQKRVATEDRAAYVQGKLDEGRSEAQANHYANRKFGKSED